MKREPSWFDQAFVLFSLLGILATGLPAQNSLVSPPFVRPHAMGAPNRSRDIDHVKAPEGVDACSWQSIQTQIHMGKFKAYPDGRGGYASANLTHGFQIAYGADGSTTLTPRNREAADYRVSLRLMGLGYKQLQKVTTPRELIPADLGPESGSKVSYAWNESLTEWWINDAGRLEQWFYLREAPGVRRGEEPLRLRLALDTDMAVQQHGNRLTLKKGDATLTYDKLRVWDANGKELTARMDWDGAGLELRIQDADAAYPLLIDPSFSQQAYLKASNTGASDSFGSSVAISGETIVVGAPWEDSNATGVNGDGSNNSGAAYVFVRSGGVWAQQAYLKASNTGLGDRFGWSVAISGETIVVGAYGEYSNATGVNGNGSNNSAGTSGAAYVFSIDESISCGCVEVNVTLNKDDCKFDLTVENLGLGLDCANLTVKVVDNNPANGSTIDCPGYWTYGLFNGNTLICWGKVRAEDKSGPLVNGYWDKLQFGAIAPNTVTPPTSTWTMPTATFLHTDLNHVLNDTRSWTPATTVANTYLYFAGHPSFSDACDESAYCDCPTDVKVTDQVVFNQHAGQTDITATQLWATITRTFTATDCMGNETRVVQEIYFLRPDAQATLWGLISGGGENGIGAIIRLNTDGSDFKAIGIPNINSSGALPNANLIQASDGKFYGMTIQGGNNDIGVIFEYDPGGSGTYTVKHHFDRTTGASPYGSLIELGGKFYGMTAVGGNNNGGVIFEYDPGGLGTYTVKHHFDLTTGGLPFGSLIEVGDKFYGMTVQGGNNAGGVIFEYDPGGLGTYTVKHQFDGTTGASPQGSLIEVGGKFYGMTVQGGNTGRGVIFEYDPDGLGTYTVKHHFDGTTGAEPYGSLVEVGGKFYGMTYRGGNQSAGVIFEYDPAKGYTVLKNLGGADGAFPRGSLITVCSQSVSIATEPFDQAVPEGGAATFRVEAAGTAPFTYQWRRNGMNIPGADSSSYTTPPVQLSDDGSVYSCVVTNCNGTNSVSSKEARLSVGCGCSEVDVTLASATSTFRLTQEILGNTMCAPGTTIRVVDNSPGNGDIIDGVGYWTYGLFGPDNTLICWGKVRAHIACNAPGIPTPITGTVSLPGLETSTTPTLTWNSVPGAERYWVSISKYPYVPATLVSLQNNTCISGTAYAVSPALQPGMLYRWDLSANSSAYCDPACEGGNSTERYFYIPPIINQSPGSGGKVILSTPVQTIPPGAMVSYQWFRNGAPVGGNSTTFTAAEPGTYIVRLTYPGTPYGAPSIESKPLVVQNFPQLTLNPFSINLQETITFNLQNFSPNGGISISVFNPNGQEQVIHTNANSSGTAVYSLAPTIPGEYAVRARDVSSNKQTIVQNFTVRSPSPPETQNGPIVILSPKQGSEFFVRSIGGRISVSFLDNMFLSGTTYPIEGANRRYWYKIEYSYDGVNWLGSSNRVSGRHPVDKIFTYGNFEINIDNRTSTNCRVRVTDMYDPSRFTISEPFRITFAENIVSFEWDHSYRYTQNYSAPIYGVAADGVGRFLIKVVNPVREIKQVTISLYDGKGNSLPAALGKVMRVTEPRVISEWSIEANQAYNNTATSYQPLQGNEHWFWYVAPDDFVINPEDQNAFSRTVNATISVGYSDNTIETLDPKKILIVRPPVILVHGLGGDVGSWDNFRLSYGLLFKRDFDRFGIPPYPVKIGGYDSFESNAWLLLDIKNSNSMPSLIKQMRDKGIACNRVDYVAHSMGGSILRYLMSDKINGKGHNLYYYFYSKQYSYGKGLVNKAITITSPHNGSPIADLAHRYPDDYYVKKIAKREGYFDQDGRITDAVKNLQADPNGEIDGGIKFSSTQDNTKFHTIASQMSCADWNFGLQKWALWSALIHAAKNEFEIPNYIGYCTELNILFNSLKYDASFIYANDIIVSTASQLAGDYSFQTEGSKTVFPGLYHSTFSPKEKQVLSNSEVADRVFFLLNQPISSRYFGPLEATPGARNENLAGLSNGQEFETVPSTGVLSSHFPLAQGHKSPAQKENVHPALDSPTEFSASMQNMDPARIMITSPGPNEVFEVDATIPVTIAVLDTNGLVSVDFLFQDQIYSLEPPFTTTTFALQVSGALIDRQEIIAVGYYISDGIGEQVVDSLTVIVRSKEQLMGFSAAPESVLLHKNNTHRPVYTATFQTFEGQLTNSPDILADIEDPSKLAYNPEDNSFTALDTGSVHAMVTYAGFVDTLYFEIVYFPTSEETPRVLRSEVLGQTVCAGSNEVLIPVETDTPTDVFRIIPEEADADLFISTFNPPLNDFEPYKTINGVKYMVVSTWGGEPIPPGAYQLKAFVANSQTGAYSDLQAITLTVQDSLKAQIDTHLAVSEGSDAVFTVSGTPGAILKYAFNDGPEQTAVLNGGAVKLTFPSASKDVTLFLLSIENPDQTCSLRLSTQAIAAVTFPCACLTHVTLTLNPNTCITRLTLDQAGLGGCSSSYTIIVADTDPSNGDIIDCPGEWTYGIFAPDGSLVCSGKVIAEDKSGPLLIGVDGRCDLPGKRQRAALPAPPNALDPTALVWRDTFLCTDLNGIFNVDASWKDAAYRYYAGRPLFADGCQSCPCAVTVNATDQATYFQCETVRNDQIWARITRTFTATDCYGNQTQAVQEIYFLRPAIPENQQPDELVLRSDACSADVDSMIAELKKNYYLHDDPYACDAEARYAYFPEAGSGKTKRLECGYSFDVTVAGGDYEVCTGGRKVSVLVHYFDWCTGKPVVIDTILLKWYDAKGPSIALPEKPVVISTGPMDCTAAFGIDLASLKDFFGVEVTDNCEGGVTVDVELWSCVDSLLYGIPVEGKKWRKTAYQTMQMNGRLMALGVPVGAHKLRITAFDQCYNQSAKEVYFEVQDKIAPVVKCDDRLNVTLTNSQGYPAAGTGGFGYAKVLASEIGEGASDNCGLAWIRVRRQYNPACLADFLARGYDSDNDGDIDAQDGIDWNQDGDFGDLMEKFEYSKVDPTILMTPALDYAEFFCCDLGAEGVMVELWAQDRYMEMSNCDGGTVRSGGNLSSCWTAVNLEDKVAPAFARPGDATIKCTDRELLDAISVGRAALSLNSPEYQYIEDRIFAAQDKGRFTILSGNECGNMELEAALIPDLHCDAGRVQIRYTGKKTIKGQPVLYPAGDAYIQVQPVHEYNLLFPEDLYGECEDLRDTANVVDGGELGCDVLAVNVSDKRYNGATLNGAPVAECYKIFRTFTVVNWCQYDEACGEPMQWAVVVPRDADGINVLVRDADGGEEAIYVEAGDTGDKVAQETERVREFRFNNPENARCPHTDELFAWMYTQYIFVHDQEAPVVLDPGTQVFYLNKTACTGDVRFLIEAEDACAPATELQQQPGAAGNLAIERARLRLDTDNDPATPPAEPIELGSHGTILPAHTLHGDDKGANKWVFSGPALPEGYHTLLVAVRDDCGNLSAVREIPFSVVDTSVAAPICHHGLSTTLMKNPDTGTGEMTVWASDFVASPIDDCNGQGPKTGPTGKPLITTYYVVKDNGDGIWDAADGLDTNGMPIIKSTSVTLTCDDAQLTQTAIRLYIEDARGNRAWCETYAVVTDPLGLCKNPAAIASVAGVIATENSKGVPEAEVSLSGGHSRFYETGKDGAYRFGGLKTGYDYSITPGLDRHPLDGVSTLDLIQIQKHILGIRPLGSPYKLLAADVNNSRSVSTLDLVQLRKLILGIETKFAHNTSWRFVDAAFLFPDPANPWKTAFPEVANINNLQADVKADFVAIKIGDVNGSALSNAQPRTSEAFRLNVEDLELKAGNEYRIAFTGEVSQIEGFQFTLGFDRNTVELVDIEYGAAGAEHFGVFAKEGLITASWDEAQGARRKAQGDTLFTLVVKAKTDATSLRDVLSINSRITRAEAYRQGGDYLNIELALTPKRLNAQTPFALYQNIPNPFSGETLIGFWLPQAGEATLTIQDVTGRTLRVVRGRYGAGYNQVLLKSEDLRGRGLLFYSLTSGAFRATRRMVVE